MIKMTEYASRRKALMKKISPRGAVILSAAKECQRNGDATYHFRQQSDFYYMTGFDEPEAVMVLLPKRKEGEYILFNRRRDRDHEIWDGPRAGQEGAKRRFLANESYPIELLQDKLPGLIAGRETVYSLIGADESVDKLIFKAVNHIRSKARAGMKAPSVFSDIAPFIHEMRLIKSPAEVSLMRHAANITAVGHIKAMQACKPGVHEYELEAELNYAFQREGARFSAYNAIVGAGERTCILHYVNNNKIIAKGDMVLIDAGAEYQCYAADVTRTFPATGRFSQEQRAIYELVLKSQLAAIASLKPGASWSLAQDIIVKIITQGLKDLGLLKGKVRELIKSQAYLPFYMHRSGHWLGLDVHDAGQYKENNQWRKLKKGMVLTVEPGIYISSDIPGVPKRWHNIGVRIEDDVLITAKGYEVLSRRVPKTVAEIESLMKG